MKRLLILVLVSLITSLLSAESLASDQFTVKGYKVKADGELQFVVVDSINESLNTFDSEGGSGPSNSVELTNHIEDLVGPEGIGANETLTTDSGRLVFSYRLSGSGNANYDICFVVDNFKGTSESNADEQIDAMYELGNFNFVFSNTKENSQRAGSYENVREATHKVTISNGASTPTDKTLRQPLSVTNAISDDYWIFRGAVFLSISETDYESAKLGNYSTTVTATLYAQ